MQADPLLPVTLIAAGVAVGVGFLVLRVRRRAPGMAIARTAAMVAFATLLAVDPTIAGGTSEARPSAADVLFVVDSTSSMAALDYNGDAPRLDGVRADILELAAQFPGAHFSLIRFDSQARLELPWTTDVGALEMAVSVIRQERAVYSRGSQLDLPLEVVAQQLPRPSAAGPSSGEAGGDGYGVVFYFSDGEERAGSAGGTPSLDPRTGAVIGDGEPITSFADLAPDVHGGAVLGYGTPAGAPMLEFVNPDNPATAADDPPAAVDSPYVFDYPAGAPAISRLDEGNLVAIADELGIPYLHRSQPGGLTSVAAAIADDAPTVDNQRDGAQRLYWIAALGLLAVVLWQAAATTNEVVTTWRLLGPPRQRRLDAPPATAGTVPVSVRRRDRESAA